VIHADRVDPWMPTAIGMAPMMPPRVATSRACSTLMKRRQPEVFWRFVWEIMFHEHAETIHLPHHVLPERCEAAVNRRRRLNVAELVDTKVDELEHALPALVRLLHAVETPLEEVAALSGHDRGAPASRAGGVEIGGRLDQHDCVALGRRQQRRLRAPGVRVQLARFRRARDVDVLARRATP